MRVVRRELRGVPHWAEPARKVSELSGPGLMAAIGEEIAPHPEPQVELRLGGRNPGLYADGQKIN